MKLRRGLVVMVSVALFFSLSYSASAASSQPFKNCTQLLKKYYWGVAFNRVAAADLANIIEIRPKIYMANKRLDTDKDGVACEDDLLQHLPPVVTTTTSSTTTTTTIPTVPIAPTMVAIRMTSPFDGTGIVTWTDNSNNEDNFYISTTDPVKLVGLPLTSLWHKASMNRTSVNPTGMLNGYNYCFWGMAANAIGNSAWSGPVCSLAGTATTTTTAYVPPTTTTTTTIAPTTTIVSRPSGTWYSRWMTLGAPNDSTGIPIGGPGLNVVYGQQTELIFCLSSGGNPSTLEVKDGGLWRKVASGFRTSSDTRRCSNSAAPITFSFYWVVDANGTKNYRKNGKEYKSRDLEIKLTTSAGVQPMLRSVGSIADAGAYDLSDTLRCAFGETSYC